MHVSAITQPCTPSSSRFQPQEISVPELNTCSENLNHGTKSSMASTVSEENRKHQPSSCKREMKAKAAEEKGEGRRVGVDRQIPPADALLQWTMC